MHYKCSSSFFTGDLAEVWEADCNCIPAGSSSSHVNEQFMQAYIYYRIIHLKTQHIFITVQHYSQVVCILNILECSEAQSVCSEVLQGEESAIRGV